MATATSSSSSGSATNLKLHDSHTDFDTDTPTKEINPSSSRAASEATQAPRLPPSTLLAGLPFVPSPTTPFRLANVDKIFANHSRGSTIPFGRDPWPSAPLKYWPDIEDLSPSLLRNLHDHFSQPAEWCECMYEVQPNDVDRLLLAHTYTTTTTVYGEGSTIFRFSFGIMDDYPEFLDRVRYLRLVVRFADFARLDTLGLTRAVVTELMRFPAVGTVEVEVRLSRREEVGEWLRSRKVQTFRQRVLGLDQ